MNGETTTLSYRSLVNALLGLMAANTLGIFALVLGWEFMTYSNNTIIDFREDTRTRLKDLSELVEQLEAREKVSISSLAPKPKKPGGQHDH